jgi:D-proline reductase (dithiol) PrdB
VGLVSRGVEAAGIATLTLSVAHDITEHVRPPRTAFLNYPMGNEVGRPHDAHEQRAILAAALTAAEEMHEPGMIVDLGFELEAAAPDGRPWQDWVYTRDFRRACMLRRDGSRYLADE